MEETTIDKQAMRAAINSKLKEMDPQQKSTEEQIIWHKVVNDPSFANSDTILLYWSLKNEVDTHQFAEDWSQQKTILLPKVEGNELTLHAYEGPGRMKAGAFGILEPTTPEWKDFDSIGLAIVPGVAFDPRGYRLGRGRGYYDRLLKNLLSRRMGVCYSCQMVDEVPTQSWDLQMDKVVTAKSAYETPPIVIP